MTEKFSGFILLITGLFIVTISFFNVYTIFKQKKMTFDFFNLPGISLDLTEFLNTELPQDQLEQIKKEKGLKTDLIPSDIINSPLNLIANMIFYLFCINIGFKISQLGIFLLRPIKVVLKENIIGKKGVI